MLPTPPWREPSWLADTLPPDRERDQTAFYIKVCAIHASPEMTVRALARRMGVSSSSLSKVMSTGFISGELAIKLEETVGRDIMPRETLCPRLFQIKE